MTPDIRPLVAGNWKMNGTRDNLDQIKAIATGLGPDLADKIDALICPPATLLYVATAIAEQTPLSIGAQDCHDKQSGAYTGDISAQMIADCLGDYVLVGHSERVSAPETVGFSVTGPTTYTKTRAQRVNSLNLKAIQGETHGTS